MQTVDRNFFPLRPGERVLDLGCGEGRHAIAFSVLDGVDAVGVDLSLDDLATARQRQQEFRDTLAPGGAPALFGLLAGDALHLPFADHTFDAVVCSEVLEHVPDFRSVLGEIARVLKPGGRLCVSVPRPWVERICWRLSRDYHQVRGGHLRIFEIAALRREIEIRGLEPYHQHGAHALHSAYWWLQCLCWRSRERNWLVHQYHRLLVWDMMAHPAFTRGLERALNPVLGKSVVMYFRKPAAPAARTQHEHSAEATP